MHARCMRDLAERLANGHVDQVSAGGEMAGSEHPAVRRIPLGGCPPAGSSHVTTDSHNTFELMVRAHGRSLTSSSPYASCPATFWAYPRWRISIPPTRKQRQAATVPCSQRWRFKRKTSCFGCVNHRLLIGPHVQDYLVGVESEWDEHLPRWVLAVQNELRTDAGLPPFPARPRATRG